MLGKDDKGWKVAVAESVCVLNVDNGAANVHQVDVGGTAHARW